MKGRVFICHASEDAASAGRIVDALERDGTPCWIAPRDIDPGENYAAAILAGLKSAVAVVLVFSSATDASPHVQRELEVAVGAGTRILPVRMEEVEPSPALRYFIGTAQWLDATGPGSTGWPDRLVAAVRRTVGTGGPDEPPARPPAVRRPSRGLVAAVAIGAVCLVVTGVVAVMLGLDDEDASRSATASNGSEPATSGPTGSGGPAPTSSGELSPAEDALLPRVGALGRKASKCRSTTANGVEYFGAEAAITCSIGFGRDSTVSVRQYTDAAAAEDAWRRYAAGGGSSEVCGIGQYEGDYTGEGSSGLLRCTDQQPLTDRSELAALISFTDGAYMTDMLAPAYALGALASDYLALLCRCPEATAADGR